MSLPMSSLLTGAVQCSVPNAKGPRVTCGDMAMFPAATLRQRHLKLLCHWPQWIFGRCAIVAVCFLLGETSENWTHWRLKVVAQLSQLQGLAEFVTNLLGRWSLRQDPPDPARVHLSQFSFTEWLISTVSFSQQTWTRKKWSHSFTWLTSWSFWRFLGFRARSVPLFPSHVFQWWCFD